MTDWLTYYFNIIGFGFLPKPALVQSVISIFFHTLYFNEVGFSSFHLTYDEIKEIIWQLLGKNRFISLSCSGGIPPFFSCPEQQLPTVYYIYNFKSF